MIHTLWSDNSTHPPTDELYVCAPTKWLFIEENKMNLVRIVAQRKTLIHQRLFFCARTKRQQTTTKKARSIEWGDRFTASQGQGSSGWMLSWSGLFSLCSFLSLRCPLGSHPSPSIPPFCLFYINTIRLGRGPHWYTFPLSVGSCTCMKKTHTYTQLVYTRTHRRLLTECGRLVNGPLFWPHSNANILTHESTPGGRAGEAKKHDSRWNFQAFNLMAAEESIGKTVGHYWRWPRHEGVNDLFVKTRHFHTTAPAGLNWWIRQH